MGGSTENSAFFTTHNPWDLTRVPGGSSGGSAAAVAAGDVIGALGTDTGGSIRMPSSYNNVVGLKPTYGRVSRWGAIAFGSSFDQIGWITNSVKNNALLTEIISGQDDHDMTSSDRQVPNWAANLNENTNVKGLRIAVPKEYLDEGIQPGVRAVINNALKHFEELGAIIDTDVSMPHTKYGVPATTSWPHQKLHPTCSVMTEFAMVSELQMPKRWKKSTSSHGRRALVMKSSVGSCWERSRFPLVSTMPTSTRLLRFGH